MSGQILSELWSIRGHVVGCTWIQAPCGRSLSHKQNFRLDWVLYKHDVRIISQYFSWRVDVFNLLMLNTLLILSPSFIILGFEGTTIGFNMSTFLAIVECLAIHRLASWIWQPLGRICPSVVRSVNRTLYYKNILSQILNERSSPTTFSQYWALRFGVAYSHLECIAHNGHISFLGLIIAPSKLLGVYDMS